MRYFLKALAIATLVIFSTTVYSQVRNPLVGTWQLVDAKGTYKENPISSDSSKVHMIKVITPTTMVFTRYSKLTDSLLMSAQGRIIVSGNNYTEIISHASNKIMKGMSFNYKYTLNGNRWRIEGGGNDLKLVEDWLKIE